MEAKEAAKKRQEEIEALNANMEQRFKENKSSLEEAARKKDTEAFWKIWSRAVEEPYIKVLELEEKEEKKMRGRGGIRLVQKTPLPRGNEDKHVRNEWSYKARRCLKQARRCEQMTYRTKCLDLGKVKPRRPGVVTPRAKASSIRRSSNSKSSRNSRPGVATPQAMPKRRKRNSTKRR